MRQRLVTGLLIVALALAGCSGEDPTPTPQPTPVPATATLIPPTPVPPTPTPVPTDTPTNTPVPTEAPPTAAPTEVPSPTLVKGAQVDAPRSVTVTALWYGTDGNGQPIGGTSQVVVSVAPNPSGQFRVGFFEGEVSGSGPMWRASGWVATTVAALLTGLDPVDTQVSFDVGGRIDGPSAGGLMTAGVLAALRGDQVRDDAAMTGTINPDGTIGPVGGIPYKIQGAAAAGKTLVLIPVGRVEQGVDLIEHGRNLGVEVREVSDIYTAYEALTNQSLPRPQAAERPQLSGPTYDRMNAKAKEWLARYQEAELDYWALPEEVRFMDDLITSARASADRSGNLAAQGMAGGSYGQAVDAAVYAVLAAETGRILELYATQGIDAVVTKLYASQAFDTKVTAIADRLKSEDPATLAGAGALISSYGALMDALGLADAAKDILGQLETVASEETAVTMIATAAMYNHMADLSLETAKDVLDLASALGGIPMPEDAPVASVAEFFRRAAEANLNLFDEVVLGPAAEPQGMSLELFRMRFSVMDFTYAQARSGLMAAPRALDAYFGGGEASAYAQLGGALSAYSATTGLIAKYYSLDAILDEDLSIIGYGKERALIDTLDHADAQARGSIAALRANGVDPALPTIFYESARLTREGDITEKMDALTSFWNVYIQAQALAYLGGLAGQ
jgi:uncharacterized protein